MVKSYDNKIEKYSKKLMKLEFKHEQAKKDMQRYRVEMKRMEKKMVKAMTEQLEGRKKTKKEKSSSSSSSDSSSDNDEDEDEDEEKDQANDKDQEKDQAEDKDQREDQAKDSEEPLAIEDKPKRKNNEPEFPGRPEWKCRACWRIEHGARAVRKHERTKASGCAMAKD